MRKERAGEVYDKQAMEIVSKNLGHNRISVIAQILFVQTRKRIKQKGLLKAGLFCCL